MINFHKTLYLVTDSRMSFRPLEEIIKEAVKGGVDIVQLREKDCPTREFYHTAVKLKKMLHRCKVPLIINDRIDIALACDADGLHIGQNDIPYAIARKLMGDKKIIGLSVENAEQAEKANYLNIDYVGASPVYGTPTKTDTAKPLGLGGLREITRISRHPVVAIGGINAGNIKDMLYSGAQSVAVVSAIMAAENPKAATQELKKILNS